MAALQALSLRTTTGGAWCLHISDLADIPRVDVLVKSGATRSVLHEILQLGDGAHVPRANSTAVGRLRASRVAAPLVQGGTQAAL